MRIKIGLFLNIERSPKDEDYREVDIPMSQLESEVESDYDDRSRRLAGFSPMHPSHGGQLRPVD